MDQHLWGFLLSQYQEGLTELNYYYLNPFDQKIEILKEYKNSLDEMTNSIFENYNITEEIQEFLQRNSYSTPTLMFHIPVDYIKETKVIFENIWAIIQLSDEPLATFNKLMTFPYNVMDRVYGSKSESNKDKKSDDVQERNGLSEDQFHELVNMLLVPKHIVQELKGFMIAWNGSIDWQKDQGNQILVESAMSLDDFLTFFVSSFPYYAKHFKEKKSK